jgi:hypothetical protein
MTKKELKNYSYPELVTYMTGNAVMALGQGKSLYNIVAEVAHLTNMWTVETQKERNEKEANSKRGNK